MFQHWVAGIGERSFDFMKRSSRCGMLAAWLVVFFNLLVFIVVLLVVLHCDILIQVSYVVSVEAMKLSSR